MATTYRVTDATTWRDLDGEIVALDIEQSVYFSIGGFGSVLWPRLVSGASPQELADVITSTFPEVASVEAAADVEEFITSCLDSGLIEATDT